MKVILFFALFGISYSLPIFIGEFVNPTPYAHSAVLANDAMENGLHPELKNHFYDNPRIAKALAGESWLQNKEMQVIYREADNIPRQKIFDVLQHAGLTQ